MSPPPIDLAPRPRRLVPVFVDADRISDVKEVLRRQGIEAFSTADGYHRKLDQPVPRIPDPELQDDESLYGRSIDQSTCDGHSLTNQSLEFESLTSTFSRLSMSRNSPCVDSYPARSAPALFSGSSPPLASARKKRYYVITVGKCTGIYYDEWYMLFYFAFIMLTCHLSRDNVKHLIDRVSNARYKGFATHRDAEENYINAKTLRKVRVVRNPGDSELYGPLANAIQ